MRNTTMVSFVLPVYNCYEELAAGLLPFIQVMDSTGYRYKIIIVDDCSAQGAAIEQLAGASHCVYIRNEKNRGKGYSVRRGFENAEGDYFVFMDGDFPFDLSVIPVLMQALESGDADMVIGDRTLASSSFPTDLPWMRKIGSHFISALAGRYITPGHYDTQCGIKGFRRESAAAVFGQLTQDRFCFDIELLFLATRKRFRIKAIPVTVKRQQGSTVRVLRDGLDVVKAIAAIYFNKMSGKYTI